MSDPSKLTLIVPDDEAAPPGEDQPKPEDFEEQAVPAVVRRLFSHKSKDVDLGPLKTGLDQVQGQIDALLEDINHSTVAGFRLNSVEVSLGISAGGSIGVVTAGVAASMSLTFERVGAASTTPQDNE
jgi:hypothetical protein